MKTYITISAIAITAMLGASAETAAVKVNLGASVGGATTSVVKVSTTSPMMDMGDKMDMNDKMDMGNDANDSSKVELDVKSFSVMRDDTEDEKMEIDSDTKVKSNDDLSVFAKTMIKKDENVTNVEVDENNVSMEYKAKAWFLGFIPFTTNATVNVENNGTVSVIYPWYIFLASTNKQEIETNVKTAVTPTIKSSVNAKLSTKAKAELLAKMQLALRSNLEASAESSK